MKIEKIDRMKVSEQVFEQIKMLIISKEWLPGRKLPSEMKLGEMFGVSRVSIRAAIQKLSAIGLVEIRNGEGTFISEPDVGNILMPLMGELSYSDLDMQELMEFRRGIEMQASFFAAKRRTEEDLQEMKQILKKMAEHREANNVELYTVEDMHFHFCIAKMSKNALLQKVMSILKDFMLAYGKTANIHSGIDLGYEKHWEIFELISEKKAVEAEQLMGVKLYEVMKDLKEKQT